jgi:hypothetical protein
MRRMAGASTLMHRKTQVREPVSLGELGEVKTLLIDIEQSPLIAMIYGTKNVYVSPQAILEPSRTVCFAAKWHGSKATKFYAEWNEGQAQMIRQAHILLSQADAVVHYYGNRFDEPCLNREFKECDLGPPAPFQSIDLYRTVHNRFFLPSYKLDYVGQWLGHGRKADSGGMELRKRLREGDPKAQAQFRKYNIRDVDLLEKVYDDLLPWIPGGTGQALHDNPDACPYCGGTDRQSRGFAHTRGGRYQRYQCKGCKGWYSDTKRVAAANVRAVA